MTDLFLGFGLFFPRMTLMYCYFADCMPPNSTPFGLDFVMAIIFPRLLIAFWAYESDQHPLWVIVYLVFTALELFRGGRTTSSRKDKGN